MSITYAEWLTTVTTILNITDDDGRAAFAALAPRYIERAELRMYRDPDLDFLATRTVDESQRTSAGLRAVPVPAKFIVLENASLITPANTAANEGTRIPLLRAGRPWCDAIWPTESLTRAPAAFETYWALFSMYEAVASGAEADEPVALPSSIIIAPTPDNSYVVEYTGTFRPAALSADNPTTFLTTYLPDLFIAASVVAGAAYQRDFGAINAPGDPSLTTYWDREYQSGKFGAAVEEARRKAQSVDWTAYAPTPLANTHRTENPAPQPPQAGG